MLDLVDDVKSLLILVYYINVFFCFILLLFEVIEIKYVKLLKVWMKDLKLYKVSCFSFCFIELFV